MGNAPKSTVLMAQFTEDCPGPPWVTRALTLWLLHPRFCSGRPAAYQEGGGGQVIAADALPPKIGNRDGQFLVRTSQLPG